MSNAQHGWFDFPNYAKLDFDNHGYQPLLPAPKGLVTLNDLPQSFSDELHGTGYEEGFDYTYAMACVRKAFKGRKIAAVAVGWDGYIVRPGVYSDAQLLGFSKNNMPPSENVIGTYNMQGMQMTNPRHAGAEYDVDGRLPPQSYQGSDIARMQLALNLAMVEREMTWSLAEVGKARRLREGTPLSALHKAAFSGINHTLYRNHVGSTWVKNNLPLNSPEYRKTFTPKVEVEPEMLDELSLLDVETALVKTIEGIHAMPGVLATLNLTLWVSSFEGDYIMRDCCRTLPSALHRVKHLDYVRLNMLRWTFDCVTARFMKDYPDLDPITLESNLYDWVESNFGVNPLEILAGYMPQALRYEDQLDYDAVVEQTKRAREELLRRGFEADPSWDLDLYTQDMGKDYREVYAT